MSVEMFCDYVHSGTPRFLSSIYTWIQSIVHSKGKRKKFAKLGEKSDFIKKQSKVTEEKKLK